MKLKVFVSSTCYDLGFVRSQLRSFIENMGYEPVMSEYDDVLFDPENHTHASCVNAIVKCDMVVLLIGSRFGGEVVPGAVDLDFDLLATKSSKTQLLANKQKLSITQCEILKAIECNIPIYTFVLDQVLNDHLFYEKNKKDKTFMKSVKYPSIEKNETAPYIFEFINFMRARSENNSYMRFSKIDDIESCLRKQWSGLFQMLLEKTRDKKERDLHAEYLNNQLEDLKAMLMSTVQAGDMKDAARGVVKFRNLVSLIDGITDNDSCFFENDSLKSILKSSGIVAKKYYRRRGLIGPVLLLVKKDKTFFRIRTSIVDLNYFENLWNEFKKMKKEVKQAIIDATRDSVRSNFGFVRYYKEDVDEYIKEIGENVEEDTLNEELV